jgi:3-dehydroquinate synthase
VVKHALIADASHWEKLQEKHWQQHDWQEIIRHSIAIKQQIVAEDPQEQGLRKILNFGHTIGHAVESYFLEHGPRLLHGEAVALGMLCEAFLSTEKSELEGRYLKDICSYVSQVWQLPLIPDEAFSTITNLALQDKKNEKGVINCTLLRKPGEAVYNQPVRKEEITEALHWYNKRGWK